MSCGVDSVQVGAQHAQARGAARGKDALPTAAGQLVVQVEQLCGDTRLGDAGDTVGGQRGGGSGDGVAQLHRGVVRHDRLQQRGRAFAQQAGRLALGVAFDDAAGGRGHARRDPGHPQRGRSAGHRMEREICQDHRPVPGERVQVVAGRRALQAQLRPVAAPDPRACRSRRCGAGQPCPSNRCGRSSLYSSPPHLVSRWVLLGGVGWSPPGQHTNRRLRLTFKGHDTKQGRPPPPRSPGKHGKAPHVASTPPRSRP